MNRTEYVLTFVVFILSIVPAGCSVGDASLPGTSGAAAQLDSAAAAPRPPAVEVFPVQSDFAASAQLIPAVVSVEGTAVVFARRDGLVTWLGGEEGTQVTKDQILARFEDDDARVQLRQVVLDGSRLSVEERQSEALVEVNRN